MMLVHPTLSSQFRFDEAHVNTLVVENRQFYRELLSDIANQMDGAKGKLVLSERDTPIQFAKNAEVITEFVPFTLNRKLLLTKLNAVLERTALEDEKYLRTQELLQLLEQYIMELSEDLACDVTCTKLSIGTILKAAGIELHSLTENPLEALVDYMLLMRDLDADRLFILVGFRSFYDDAETRSFLRTVIDHGLRVMLIDSMAHPLLYGEKRVTIDQDLCEF